MGASFGSSSTSLELVGGWQMRPRVPEGRPDSRPFGPTRYASHEYESRRESVFRYEYDSREEVPRTCRLTWGDLKKEMASPGHPSQKMPVAPPSNAERGTFSVIRGAELLQLPAKFSEVRFAPRLGGAAGWRKFMRIGAPSSPPVVERPRVVYFSYRGGIHSNRPVVIVKAEVPATASVRYDPESKEIETDRWRPIQFAEAGNASNLTPSAASLKWVGADDAEGQTLFARNIIGIGQEQTEQIVFSEGWARYGVRGVTNAFLDPAGALHDGRPYTIGPGRRHGLYD